MAQNEQVNNELVMRRYIQDVLNKGDLGSYEQLVSPRYVDHSPGHAAALGLKLPKSSGVVRDDQKHAITALRQAIPDLHYVIKNITAEGDTVHVDWTVQGTHSSNLMGVAPTGRKMMVSGNCHARFENGQIAEGWAEYNLDSVKAQIS